ncbi:MAG: hypothetical protein ACTSRC_18710 [Candidatus Helarchaeota archaeon]
MRRQFKVWVMLVCLSLVVLFSSIYISQGVISTSQSNSRLHLTDIKYDNDFTDWTLLDTSYTDSLYLTPNWHTQTVFSVNACDLAYAVIENDHTYTHAKGPYHMYYENRELYAYVVHRWSENKLCSVGLLFENPNPMRNYVYVTYEADMHLALTDNNPAGKWFTYNEAGDYLDTGSALYNGYFDGVYTVWTSTQVDTAHQYLGGQWPAELRQKFQRKCGGIWNAADDVRWSWDYASLTWGWLEYAPCGTASKIFSLSDEEHTWKNVNNITFTADGEGTVQLQYRAMTPMGWWPSPNAWCNITNGEALNIVASEIEVRFVLYPEPTLRQQTPDISDVTITYGPPPVETPPTISNVQQFPSSEHTGYRDTVNITCNIETYTNLTTAEVQYTLTGNWSDLHVATLHQIERFDHTSTYSGIIPPVERLGTVTYRVYAENFYGLNTTSVEFNYTTIDNIGPMIVHDNATDVSPTSTPLPSSPPLVISCYIADELGLVNSVYINCDLVKDTETVSFNTLINGQGSTYNYELTNPLTDVLYIEYTFEAEDDSQNIQISPKYRITIDRSGPEIMSWSEPELPEYDDQIWINAVITDPNGIDNNSVVLNWTVNEIDYYSIEMAQQENETVWRSVFPVTAKPYGTVLCWEITARDNGSNEATEGFNVKVDDFTPPTFTDIHFITPAVEGMQFIINFTLDEPGSGIDPINPKIYVYYWLASVGMSEEDKFVLAFGSGISGPNEHGHWAAIIPAQEYNETVTWCIYVEDLAGNPTQSTYYVYIVKESATLLNWINFSWWVLIMCLLTGTFAVYRRVSAKKGQSRVKGNMFVGLGVATAIGISGVLWLTVLPWFDIHNLSFQEWTLQIGQTQSWVLVIILFTVMFFVFAANLGILYQTDKHVETKYGQFDEFKQILRQIDRDLDEKYVRRE